MQRPLVGEAEPAQRGELLIVKVVPIVGKNELAVVNFDGCLRRAGVIRVLQKLGRDVTGTLDLPEQLMPWASEFRVAL